jgi:Activator of Hsp90 ATPase homolog 1-like protein
VKITVETTVNAPIAEVWRAYNTPSDIMQWNAASDDWHATASAVNLREGGAFSSRMEAKDGSFGFDFAGTYTWCSAATITAAPRPSLHRHTLRQISRLIHITPALHRDVIRQQLQRHTRQHRRQHVHRFRNPELVVQQPVQ